MRWRSISHSGNDGFETGKVGKSCFVWTSKDSTMPDNIPPPTIPRPSANKKHETKNCQMIQSHLFIPSWRSLSHLKGSPSYPKKVTKNCQVLVLLPTQKSDAPSSLHCLLCTSSKVLAAATAAGLCAPLRSTNL